MHNPHATSPLPRYTLATVGLAVLLGLTACSKGDGPASHQPVAPSATATPADGQTLFNRSCARCHGQAGTGSQAGPPLVHKIYEPSHHPDAAFYRAAAQGVRAHHWQFGNMPRIGGVNTDQVTAIIAYVRGLQRDAGIH